MNRNESRRSRKGVGRIPAASTRGAVPSRHGPVATIVWEQIREAAPTANPAMLVRERLGVQSFDEVTDPNAPQLKPVVRRK